MIFLAWATISIAVKFQSWKEPSFSPLLQALMLFAILLPIILVTGALSHNLLSNFQEQDIIVKLKNNTSNDLAFRVFMVLALAPLLEEFYFRGTLLPRLEATVGLFWAIFISSAFFALVHQNIYALPTLFSLGITLGVISSITRNWLVAAVCHSLFNGIMLISILAF